MIPSEAITFLQSLSDDMSNINLSTGETITNMKAFKETHICRLQVKEQEGVLFSSILNRVERLKEVLTNKE